MNDGAGGTLSTPALAHSYEPCLHVTRPELLKLNLAQRRIDLPLDYFRIALTAQRREIVPLLS